MDYDAYDAILHHVFKQTQGDAWFKPSEENVSAGVCLRVNPGHFRVFPYENRYLIPFEQAVRLLNPVVAVKVRSAAVHAALATITDDDVAIFLDTNTRIQILDTMSHLPRADKEQCAAFVRDERVMVIWTDTLDGILPLARDFEDKLIKLVWRSRVLPSSQTFASSRAASMITSSSSLDEKVNDSEVALNGGSEASEKEQKAKPVEELKNNRDAPPKKKKRFGWRATKKGAEEKEKNGFDDLEDGKAAKKNPRPIRLFAPVYGGLGAGLSIFFMGSGVSVLLREFLLDNSFMRFALAITIPFLFCVSLFFSLQVITNISFVLGPVAQYHENSKDYSAVKPSQNKEVDEKLPHVTIQMPVYKESLKETITPSVFSLKKAMQTYARQGGTSSIFINDDGLQLLSETDRNERIEFYADHGIGWVARPKHEDGDEKDGAFKRKGRFKKASNMNYGLNLSLRMEACLKRLEEEELANANGSGNASSGRSSLQERSNGTATTASSPKDRVRFAIGGNNDEKDDSELGDIAANRSPYDGSEDFTWPDTYSQSNDELEERALTMAVEEIYAETGNKHKPWASVGNAKNIRIGGIILIVDSDTVVPEDCLRDAARELTECPEVAIIQHESDVMQVAFNYFENGIAHFTRRINKCISMACANGEVAPFVGHNAFLRWSAIQDVAFIDPQDGIKKIWSESNVSEDFDMALRLQLKGYIIRWASYSNGGFKEGVSLTCDDELNRWQKYAYGCNELLFNPLVQWWRKGPINKQLHTFVWSGAPIHYKLSMMAYMFSYYGLAAGVTLSVLNYVILGFAFPVDGYYMHSFEIWLACTVVFPGAGNVAFTLLEYRLGTRSLVDALIENVTWVPFFFFFFGGLSIHLSQALLAHLFSYNITWGATKKEVERSNFFLEVPKIWKRFRVSFIISFILLAGMIVLSTNVVPLEWRVQSFDWAVIFPLAIVCGCHILYPIVLNPWLMIFSY